MEEEKSLGISNLGLSVRSFAFPMRCHPQADAGDREAVDEESELRFGIWCSFSLHINGFCLHPYEKLNPLSSSVTPYGRATFPAGEG